MALHRSRRAMIKPEGEYSGWFALLLFAYNKVKFSRISKDGIAKSNHGNVIKINTGHAHACGIKVQTLYRQNNIHAAKICN